MATTEVLVGSADLALEVKARAASLGFDLVRIASAEPMVEAERAIVERIGRGLFRGLDWFTADRARLACDPRNHFPGALSVVSLGISYLSGSTPPSSLGDWPTGLVARYAWGEDYHTAIGRRLRLLSRFMLDRGAGHAAPFVDAGRMVDRAAAQRAGLGWFGKNTNILTRRYGSWVFLAEVLTDLDLDTDGSVRTDCGRCTRCIEACPTRAIIAPGVLDCTRCISFLTIELRESIPHELRPLAGAWVFGCDVCQDVCPVNWKAEPVNHREFDQANGPGRSLDLIPLMALTEEDFRRRFRGTSVWRTKRRGLLRNAAVALGNLGDSRALPALAAALQDPEPLVRSHSAWAIGRLGGRNARRSLDAALLHETDAAVRDEIGRALEAI